MADLNIAKFNIPIKVQKDFDKGKIADSYNGMITVANEVAANETLAYSRQIARKLADAKLTGVEVDAYGEALKYKNERIDYHMKNMIHLMELHVASHTK
jgi:hypothetical protein